MTEWKKKRQNAIMLVKWCRCVYNCSVGSKLRIILIFYSSIHCFPLHFWNTNVIKKMWNCLINYCKNERGIKLEMHRNNKICNIFLLCSMETGSNIMLHWSLIYLTCSIVSIIRTKTFFFKFTFIIFCYPTRNYFFDVDRPS